jgi:glycosyltransferase involved in cell wall biosynthesis
LRVLQVDKFLRRYGGAAAYMLDLGELLTQRGHRVEYFSVHHAENLSATYQDLFPEVPSYEPPPRELRARLQAGANMFWSREAGRAMEAVLEDFQPDIVHLHNIYHQLSPSVLRPIGSRGIPMVMTLHDFKLICPTYRLHDGRSSCEACLGGGFHHAVLRRCKSGSIVNSALLAAETAVHRHLGAYDSVDRLVCPSRFLLEKLLEAGFDPDRLEHLPNFTSLEPVTELHQPGEAVVSIGRLSQEKGIDTLIEACAIPPALPLRIAGTGPLEDRLRSSAAGLAPDTTAFLGQLDRPGVIGEIDHARVVVFPARGYENMPLAILEAMSRGKPVIVTDIGGSPELIENDVGGITVPPDDPVALRAAIDRFTDPDFARLVGDAGVQRVRDHYLPSGHVERIESLYRRLLS